jgi:hypothetical protein
MYICDSHASLVILGRGLGARLEVWGSGPVNRSHLLGVFSAFSAGPFPRTYLGVRVLETRQTSAPGCIVCGPRIFPPLSPGPLILIIITSY